MTIHYETFDALPEWVKTPVRRFRPKDAETWVFTPVPALGNESLMKVMNAGEEGEARIRAYLNTVMGRFFA